MSADSLSKFVELAFHYGPFFFSIWFLIGVSRWAYKKYHEAKPDETTTLRNIFVASFSFGIILVAASVYWWFIYRPTTFIYQGKIDKLDTYDNLESNDIYFKSITHYAPGYPNPPKTAYFIIVASSPFQKGQQYNVNLYKGQTKVELNPLVVPVDPNDAHPDFTAECCDKDGKVYLKHADPPNLQSSLSTDVVYASAPSQSADQGMSLEKPRATVIKKGTVNTTQFPITTDPIDVRLFQSSIADIGAKAAALLKMTQLDAQELGNLMDQPKDGPPLVLTLLDFTRHSDRQIAFRSKEVLQKLNVDDYIASELAAARSRDDRAKWESILFRINQTEAMTIMSLAAQKGWTVPPSLRADVESGKMMRLLVPTWTPSGEMYYLKTMWDPKNVQVQTVLEDCFTQSYFLQKTVKHLSRRTSSCDKRKVFGMCTGAKSGYCTSRIKSVPVEAPSRSSILENRKRVPEEGWFTPLTS